MVIENWYKDRQWDHPTESKIFQHADIWQALKEVFYIQLSDSFEEQPEAITGKWLLCATKEIPN